MHRICVYVQKEKFRNEDPRLPNAVSNLSEFSTREWRCIVHLEMVLRAMETVHE